MASRARGQRQERGRARACVVLADVIAAVAVALLTTDALRPGVPLRALLTIVVWAVVPRIAAQWIEKPKALFASQRLLLRARLIAVMTVLVGFTLSRLALAAIPVIGVGSDFELVLLIACWAAGFTLRDTGAYRVYEPLCCATLVAALLRGSSAAIPLVATAFGALLFSAALRHQLGRSSVSNGVRRVNVRHAGLAAAVLAAVLVVIFAIGDVGAGALIRQSRSEPTDRAGDPELRRTERQRPEVGQNPGAGMDSPADFAPDWSTGAHGANFAGSLGMHRRGIVRTETLGQEILRVTPARDGPTPGPDTLWRARTYLLFDAVKEEWADQGLTLWNRPPMSGDTMLNSVPDLGGVDTRWQVTVMTGRLDSLLLPYFASEVRFPGNPDVDLRVNSDGDVCAEGDELTNGKEHRITLRPFDATHLNARGLMFAAPVPSPAYIAIPKTGKLADHVRAVAHTVLGTHETRLFATIGKLQTWFHRSYRYVLDPAEGKTPDSLSDFMLRVHAGDCRHLASAAALLLRAADIPARLADGFLGAEPGERPGTWSVRNSEAHVWVEVLSQSGWIPIDPTSWVASQNPGRRTRALGPGVGFGNPDEDGQPRDAGNPPDLDRSRTPDSSDPPWILTAITAVLGIVAVFLIARSWRRTPEAEDPKKEDEGATTDADAPSEPVLDFVPRTPAEHLLLDYTHLQGDLAGSGQERQSHETPREHARRVSAVAGDPTEAAFGSLVPLVDDGLYGKVSLTDGDLARGRGAIGEIRRELA